MKNLRLYIIKIIRKKIFEYEELDPIFPEN